MAARGNNKLGVSVGVQVGGRVPQEFLFGIFFSFRVCVVRASGQGSCVTGRRPSSTLAIRLGAFPLASGTSFRLDVFAEEINGFQYEMFLGF